MQHSINALWKENIISIFENQLKSGIKWNFCVVYPLKKICWQAVELRINLFTRKHLTLTFSYAFHFAKRNEINFKNYQQHNSVLFLLLILSFFKINWPPGLILKKKEKEENANDASKTERNDFRLSTTSRWRF